MSVMQLRHPEDFFSFLRLPSHGRKLLPPAVHYSLVFFFRRSPTLEHRKISWRPDVKQSSSLDGAVITLNLCHALTHLSPLNHRSIAANGRRI
jgi:hypothetical protein